MSLKRVAGIAAAICTGLLLLNLSAFAADAPSGTSVREVCAADFAKFCAGKEPRSEDGRACSRAHRAEFSEPCRTAMEARRKERTEKIKAACGPELAKFCTGNSGTDEGPGRCLRSHEAELSESCKAAFPNRNS